MMAIPALRIGASGRPMNWEPATASTSRCRITPPATTGKVARSGRNAPRGSASRRSSLKETFRATTATHARPRTSVMLRSTASGRRSASGRPATMPTPAPPMTGASPVRRSARSAGGPDGTAPTGISAPRIGATRRTDSARIHLWAATTATPARPTSATRRPASAVATTSRVTAATGPPVRAEMPASAATASVRRSPAPPPATAPWGGATRTTDTAGITTTRVSARRRANVTSQRASTDNAAWRTQA